MKLQARSLVYYFALPFLTVISTGIAQQHPFQDYRLPAEERIDNLLSLLTLDEKISCLSATTSVPRLGIRGTGHLEGLHGLAKGGPSNWGQRDPVTTTIFPQAIGLAESWDPEVLRRVGAIEGYEARFMFQSEKYKKVASLFGRRTPISAETRVGAELKNASGKMPGLTERW